MNGWTNTHLSVTKTYNDIGGLDQLEELQKHPNIDIYNQSNSILTNYFEVVESMDESNYKNMTG